MYFWRGENMEIHGAALKLTEKFPVRRLGWGPGEYVINSDQGLTYCKSYAETYNFPMEKTAYSFSLEDIMADDWVVVEVLPPHGYLVQSSDREVNYFKPLFFWLEEVALEERRNLQKKYPQLTLEVVKVTKNLFGFGVPLP